MADSRLDKLEAVVREMRKRLEPQAMRDSLERAWDPRGTADWTRVTDSAGAPASPPRRLLQFPGATITDDPTIGDRGATVVTISGGGGGAAYRFADTALPIAVDEQIVFAVESGPGTNHAAVFTGTAGASRSLTTIVAEDINPLTAAFTGPLVEVVVAEDAATPSLAFQIFGLAASFAAKLGLQLNSGPTAASTSMSASPMTPTGNERVSQIYSSDGVLASKDELVVTAPGVSGLATDYIIADNSSGAPSASTTTGSLTYNEYSAVGTGAKALYTTSYVSASDVAVVSAEVSSDAGANSDAVIILRTDGISSMPRLDVNQVVRERGPFQAVPAAIAAGGSATVTVSNALFGTGPDVVLGTVSGAAGMELVQVSWAPGPGVNQITISFTNTSLGSLTPTYNFFTRCNA